MKKIGLILICVLLLMTSGCQKETTEEVETTVIDEKVEEIAEVRTAIVFKLLEGAGITVLRNNESEDAYEGMRILGGDSLITDEVSQVYLRVDDDKNILLGNKTKMNVEELSDGKLILELEYGEFFFNVENKLKADEEMSFRIGSTSMSIRGTSGSGASKDGEASFAIYTGKGVVTDEKEGETEYEVLPNTIAHFETSEEKKTIEVASLKKEEIPSMVEEYLEENEEYKNELEEEGWNVEEGELAPLEEIKEDKKEEVVVPVAEDKPTETVVTEEIPVNEQSAENNSSESIREESEEEQKGEPEPQITYLVKPTITSKTFVYDGNTHSLTIEGYNAVTMDLKGSESAKKAGIYTVFIKPKNGYQWTDNTTDSVTGTLTITQKPLTIELNPIADITYGTALNTSAITTKNGLDKVANDDVSISVKADTNINAGEHSVTVELTGKNADNYSVIPTDSFKYTIKTKSITATLSGVPQSKKYKTSLDFSGVTVDFTGLEYNDVLGYDFYEKDVNANVGVGVGEVLCTLSGEKAGNYEISSYVNNTFTICERNVKLSIAYKTWNGSGEPFTVSAVTAEGYDEFISGDSLSYKMYPLNGRNLVEIDLSTVIDNHLTDLYRIYPAAGSNYTVYNPNFIEVYYDGVTNTFTDRTPGH